MFLGGCLNKGGSWPECKAQLLSEYFPYFVHVKLIRDLMVFNFWKEAKSLHAYADPVIRAAHLLRTQLVSKS